MCSSAPITLKTEIVGRHAVFTPWMALRVGDLLSVEASGGKGGGLVNRLFPIDRARNRVRYQGYCYFIMRSRWIRGDLLTIRRPGQTSVAIRSKDGQFCGRLPKEVGEVARCALDEGATLLAVCMEEARYDQYHRGPSSVSLTLQGGSACVPMKFRGLSGIQPAAQGTNAVQLISTSDYCIRIYITFVLGTHCCIKL